MTDEQMETEYRVGDTVYEVKPFKGSKGVRAFAIISRVGERSRPLWEADARFQKDFRELNQKTITRDLAQYRVEQATNQIIELEARAKAFQDEPIDAAREEERRAEREAEETMIAESIAAAERGRDEWVRLLEGPLKEKEELTIPQNPSNETRAMAAFPGLWEVAEPEMTMLLGLVLIPEDKLREARATDSVDDACKELGEGLLDELEMDEVAELLLVAVKTGLERFQARKTKLGNLAAGVRQMLTPAETTDQEEAAASGMKTEPTIGSVVEPQPNTNGGSSSDSPEPSDGTPTESSTENSGQTLSPTPN